MSTGLVVVRSALGVVVIVDVDPAAAGLSSLPDDERALAVAFGDRRKATFVAGRRALRLALVEAGAVDGADVAAVGPILRDERGAPVLPAPLAQRFRASITHKDTHAAAVVVAVADAGGACVGVDLEVDERQARSRVDGIARQTLHAHEHAHLPDEDDERRRAVLLRFSAKEALYKAIDPFVRRYVGFLEVGVVVDGGALAFSCPARTGLHARGVVVDVGDPRLIVTLCHARRVDAVT
jgi:4'-phosphopantetheinyl transferase EntD